MTIALRMGAFLHVLDLILSCVLLSIGWMQEANPLASLVYREGGMAGLIAFKMFFVIAAVMVISRAIDHAPRMARLACAVTVGAGTYAVIALCLVIDAWMHIVPV